MREGDALARGNRLVGPSSPGGRRTGGWGPEVNRFEVLVSDDGDTRVERYGGDLKRGRVRSPPAG